MKDEAAPKKKRGRPRSTPDNEKIEVILIPVVESDENFEERRVEVQEILKKILPLGMRKDTVSDVLEKIDPEV
ncbi:hypothetical protein [Bdellovibrio bacteriovorus]|uniref:hypothetical protein n=1 Tax=Bdellovibrio bacteriovorus TaxID=959 RepID=UPI0035A57970